MESVVVAPAVAAAAKIVAAIDLGTNSIRMVIAQVAPDGQIEALERLQRAVRLGQDTFGRGRLGAESMRAAVAVLRDYKQMLDLYKVERVRAVTTSAVREAVNADNFLDRIYMATGLNVEVIATSEESRLTVSAVRQALGESQGVNHGLTLVAEVGGGTTLLTLLDGGEIATSLGLRLGSIRLQEMLATGNEPPERSAEILRHHIAGVIASAEALAAVGQDPHPGGPRRRRPLRRAGSRPAHRLDRPLAGLSRGVRQAGPPLRDARHRGPLHAATRCPLPKRKPWCRRCWSINTCCGARGHAR